jgi:hypothetical protein
MKSPGKLSEIAFEMFHFDGRHHRTIKASGRNTSQVSKCVKDASGRVHQEEASDGLWFIHHVWPRADKWTQILDVPFYRYK